jgi:hypothetical protein
MNLTMEEVREIVMALIGRANAAAANMKDLHVKFGPCPAQTAYRDMLETSDRLACKIEAEMNMALENGTGLFRLERGPASEYTKNVEKDVVSLMLAAAEEACEHFSYRDIVSGMDGQRAALVAYNIGRYDALKELEVSIVEIPF